MSSTLSPQVEANFKDLRNSYIVQQLFTNNLDNSPLNKKDLIKIAKAVKRIQIPPYSRIFEQGETGLTAGILVKGKLYGEIAYTDLDEPVTFAIEEKGSLYGEISLVTGLKRSASIYTKKETVEVLELSIESFAILLSLHPNIPRLLTRIIQKRYEANKVQYQRLQLISDSEVQQKFKPKNLLSYLMTILSSFKYDA